MVVWEENVVRFNDQQYKSLQNYHRSEAYSKVSLAQSFPSLALAPLEVTYVSKATTDSEPTMWASLKARLPLSPEVQLLLLYIECKNILLFYFYLYLWNT